MCHPDEDGAAAANRPQLEEVAIPVPSGDSMPAGLARPATAGPVPGVVVLVDIYGRSAFYDSIARRLSDAGFLAIVPDQFHREGPLADKSIEQAMGRRARWDEPRALQDYSAACDWLQASDDTSGDKVGVVGFCLGGTHALHLAADRDDVATACFYGFPGGTPAPPGVATIGAPLDKVDDIDGPVIAFWGDQDERAGQQNIVTLGEQMAERGRPYEATIYPGLDHGFLAALDDPSSPGHAQATEAWDKTIDFLRRNLSAQG